MLNSQNLLELLNDLIAHFQSKIDSLKDNDPNNETPAYEQKITLCQNAITNADNQTIDLSLIPLTYVVLFPNNQ